MARFLFKLRNTSCFLIELRSAISVGSSRACSTMLATYPALPCWNSLIEASERSSVQHQREGPGWDFFLLVTPHVYNSTLTKRSCLHDPDLLGPSLGLGFLRWEVSPRLHHFIPLWIPFSLFISKVSLGDLGRGKGGRLWLNYHFRSISPNIGLQQVQEARFWLALQPHSFQNEGISLYLAYLC